MIIRHFLLWARTAPPGQRAEALGALARAYLYSDLSPDDRWEAETAMTALLDHPSPMVRRALAEAFANAGGAPHHIVIALANDQSDIAALVLARSPVLSEADLIDCAALGDELVQTAIALRPHVPVPVSAALAEIAAPTALAALLENRGAMIAEMSLVRIAGRHGSDPRVREALLARPELPLSIRQDIAVAVSQMLSTFVLDCGWLSRERAERVAREAREKATVSLSAEAEAADVVRLVAHLRRTGQLTPALILRAMLSRAIVFAEMAFADLSGLSAERVSALLRDERGGGFGPLYRKAGLPMSLKPAFEAALSALRAYGPTMDGSAQLSRRVIDSVLAACRNLPLEEAGKLMALLRRFESEAAREEARGLAEALADDAALAVVMEHAPYALVEDLTEGPARQTACIAS